MDLSAITKVCEIWMVFISILALTVLQTYKDKYINDILDEALSLYSHQGDKSGLGVLPVWVSIWQYFWHRFFKAQNLNYNFDSRQWSWQ